MDECDNYYVCDDCEQLICGQCVSTADYCKCATPVRKRIARRIAARRVASTGGEVAKTDEEE